MGGRLSHRGSRIFNAPYSLSVALTLFFDQGPLFFQYGSLIHDSSQLGGAGGGILRSGGFCHQLTGLVVQLAQPPFNIGKTHALAGNRSQLHFHGGGDLPDQRTLLTHDGVDCGEDCLLERFLVQRW